ncbi:MAG: cytochrome c oxidase accessory protein CcoG [Phycisphaerae bacterium]|nr:cytochrome c oxidase accessory protein CcoG [Phycisphaerae bacterium]
MNQPFSLPQLNERVLSTLNADGSRRWMTPRTSRGRYWRARAIVAWSLIIVFAALPWLRINGKPPLLLDLMLRQFTFFGTTFRPTETLFLSLLLLTIFVGIFLVTAVLGRVWCGWVCPQTVYMEFLYRPVEKFMLGRAYGRKDQHAPAWRVIALYAVFLVFSAHLANTFLAYFVGTDRLVEWTLGNPWNHPVAFAVFAVTLGLMMFDFAFFREQMCTLACPYGRFQSVLLDRDSLVIGYDRKRGEPRAKGADRKALQGQGAPAGDCIDCTLCVQVCPTGIDIREGLQLECVNCAQCIDACDDVMVKIGSPKGLIRYDTQNALEGKPHRTFRYRLAIYGVVLAALATTLVVLLLNRSPALVGQARIVGSNFTVMPDGRIATPLQLLIENHTDVEQTYLVSGVDDLEIEGGSLTVSVPPAEGTTVSCTVLSPASSFKHGVRKAHVRVTDQDTYDRTTSVALTGPFTVPTARETKP